MTVTVLGAILVLSKLLNSIGLFADIFGAVRKQTQPRLRNNNAYPCEGGTRILPCLPPAAAAATASLICATS
jgi:hypothetical protein